MHETLHLTGSLTNDHTVHLDQTVPALNGPIRLVVEVPAPPEMLPEPKESLKDFLARIHAEQKARGHVPPTVEDVMARVNAERDSWERS